MAFDSGAVFALGWRKVSESSEFGRSRINLQNSAVNDDTLAIALNALAKEAKPLGYTIVSWSQRGKTWLASVEKPL